MGAVCAAGSPRRRGAALEETGILLVPTDMAKALSNTSEIALRIHRSLKRPLRPLLVASMQGALESFRVTFRGAEVTRNHENGLKTGYRRGFMSHLAHARLHERFREGGGCALQTVGWVRGQEPSAESILDHLCPHYTGPRRRDGPLKTRASPREDRPLQNLKGFFESIPIIAPSACGGSRTG